jgi:hypothetical protein
MKPWGVASCNSYEYWMKIFNHRKELPVLTKHYRAIIDLALRTVATLEALSDHVEREPPFPSGGAPSKRRRLVP